MVQRPCAEVRDRGHSFEFDTQNLLVVKIWAWAQFLALVFGHIVKKKKTLLVPQYPQV